MRLLDTARTFWLLPLLLAGCSSTMGSRFGGTPQSRSIAVVGERPLPASTGEPGGKVVADAEEPEPRRNPKTRISGRVVDEAGEPVAGATVRLADGGVKGGKEIRGVTDRSGGFTLNGLRPGSSYVLIAEGDDDRGPILGRAEATTAETGVEIALAPETKATAARKAAKPPRARPISSREEAADDAPARVNREDLAPPAGEADEIDPGPPQPRPGRPQLSKPEPTAGWKANRGATASRPRDEDVASDSDSASSDSPGPRTRRPARGDEQDEGEDPLPPALDPEDPGPGRPASARRDAPRKVGARSILKPQEAGEIALAPEASVEPRDQGKSPNGPTEPAPAATVAGDLRPMPTLMPDPDPAPPRAAPPALPPVGGESVVAVAHEGPSPTPSPPDVPARTNDSTPAKPASQPVFASQGDALAEPAPAPPAEYNPFASLPPAVVAGDRIEAKAPVDRPTPAVGGPIGVEEPPKKKWGELASLDRPAEAARVPVKVQPTKATLTGSIFRRMRAQPEKQDAAVAACTYDAKLRKVVDFRLPDLEGKPVRFQELDADFILLDFWGTWCAPCIDAIPHLVALQKKYGPDRLKVVGIACEQAPPDQRKAKVDEASRKLGINYPVLLSTMDGKPCPVQEALQIQAMPTLILVDRKGQVLWRNAGSTPSAEGKLDRILAMSLARSESARR